MKRIIIIIIILYKILKYSHFIFDNKKKEKKNKYEYFQYTIQFTLYNENGFMSDYNNNKMIITSIIINSNIFGWLKLINQYSTLSIKY